MRFIAFAALAALPMLAASPAPAQTYGSGYPVCLQVYGPAPYIDCGYNTIAQCNATASGRPAQCVTNPYGANARMDRPPLGMRHPRRAY